MIACLIVPPQVRFVPLYMLFSHVGLINTYAALILPYAVSALGTFLIREAFMQISDDVVDAARVDGAGIFTLIFRIMVPIARPALVAFGALQRGLSLERLLLAARDDDDRRACAPCPSGVAMLREEGTGARWHIIMAGSMFVVAPGAGGVRRGAAPDHPRLHLRLAQVTTVTVPARARYGRRST